MNQLKSAVAAVKAAPYVLHLATPSPVVEVSDVDEQIKFIREEFEPFFQKYHSMLAIIENRFKALEALDGWSMPVQRISSEIETLQSLMPKALKSMNYDLLNTLERLPNTFVNDIFINVCEDPNLVLDSDMLF